MIKKIKSSHKLKIVLIQSIFILFAIGFACGSIYINKLALLDSSFHYSRIIELSKDLQFGKIPAFNLNSMIPYGDAIPTFYPWVCLMFIAPLVYFLHNVTLLWSIIVFIIMLLGFEISYYSSYQYFKRHLKSFIFSIIYCLSTIAMSCAISDCDIGEFFGIMLAPLVIFGWLYWIKDNKWKMMTIGLVLMTFTHVLSTFIVFISLFILTVCFYKNINNKVAHFANSLKSLIVLALSSCIIWLPMVVLLRHNAIEAPVAAVVGENLSIPVIPNSIGFLAAPYLFKVWTFSDLVCFILSIIYWKRLNKTSKKFIFISLCYIILNFNWIKIPLLLYTPLGILQFMCRICFVSHLLISIVLTNIIVDILFERWYIQNALSLLFVLLVLNVGSVYLTYACLNITNSKPTSELLRNVQTHTKITSKQNNIIRGKWTANNYLYNTNLFKHGEYYVDYLPINMIKGNYNKYLDSGIAENNKNYKIRPKNNGIIKFYMGHKHKKLILPITMYNNQKYHLKLDGKYINPTKSFNKKIGLVQLHNVHKGWHKIQLITPMMDYRSIALFLSFVGLSLLLILNHKDI